MRFAQQLRLDGAVNRRSDSLRRLALPGKARRRACRRYNRAMPASVLSEEAKTRRLSGQEIPLFVGKGTNLRKARHGSVPASFWDVRELVNIQQLLSPSPMRVSNFAYSRRKEQTAQEQAVRPIGVMQGPGIGGVSRPG